MDRRVRFFIYVCPTCRGVGYTAKLKFLRFDARYMPCEECQPDAYHKVREHIGEYELREEDIQMHLDELVQYRYMPRPSDYDAKRYDIFDRKDEILVSKFPTDLGAARSRCRVLNMNFTRQNPVL